MLAIAWPSLFIAFIPIVITESWYLHNRLGVPFGRSIKVMTIANLESTIVGIPLAWLAMLLIEFVVGFLFSLIPRLPNALNIIFMVTFGAALPIPVESTPYWVVPVACLVLLVPFYFITWGYEYMSVRRQLEETDPMEIKIATRNLNLISYGALGVIDLGWLFKEITKSI